MESGIRTIQLVIIALYLALTAGIGVFSMRRSKSSDSFHGASMGVFAIVCASAGEWLGGTATIGVSEYGFTSGLSGAWFTLANGIGVMFLALLFAKLYRSLNSVTVPGIIEKFFGVRARTVSSILLTIVMLAVGLSQMIAAGKLGESLLGLDFTVTVLVFGAVFIVYTLAGGMNAVAATNKMHLFVLYGGVILAIVFSLGKIGGVSGFRAGISEIEAAGQQQEKFFNMFSIGLPKVSSWIIASLLGACTAQAAIQPVLASKDVPSAKRACVITAFVIAPFGFLTALLGMIARVYSHNGILLGADGLNVTGAKLALPTLMTNLPGPVGGLVLASMIAALSTVSPVLLSMGTMVTKDLYQRVIKPSATDAEVLRMSRITTALSGVGCCAAAIALVDASRVLDIVYAAYSLRGAVFIIVLLGIYWKRASEKAACWSMVLTGVVAVAWKAYNLIEFREISDGVLKTVHHYPIADWFTETYAAVATAFIAMVLLSLIFPKKELRTAQ